MSKFVSLYSLTGGVHKPGRSRKGCMRGKGGPENAFCTFKGVRQRSWGKWVSEIRERNRGARKWLGTFKDCVSAAMAYDKAAIEIFGPDAKVNFPYRLHQVARPNHDANPDQVTMADHLGKGNQVEVNDESAGVGLFSSNVNYGYEYAIYDQEIKKYEHFILRNNNHFPSLDDNEFRFDMIIGEMDAAKPTDIQESLKLAGFNFSSGDEARATVDFQKPKDPATFATAVDGVDDIWFVDGVKEVDEWLVDVLKEVDEWLVDDPRPDNISFLIMFYPLHLMNMIYMYVCVSCLRIKSHFSDKARIVREIEEFSCLAVVGVGVL